MEACLCVGLTPCAPLACWQSCRVGSKDPRTQMLCDTPALADVWVLLTLMGRGKVSAWVCVLFFCWHSWDTPVLSQQIKWEPSRTQLAHFSWVKDHTCYFSMSFVCWLQWQASYSVLLFMMWIMPWGPESASSWSCSFSYYKECPSLQDYILLHSRMVRFQPLL